MNWTRRVFAFGYVAIVILFAVCGFALIFFSLLELFQVFIPREAVTNAVRFNTILEAIGLLTIAVAALELAQTILEEEVMREAHMSGPTRVRRFMSRFMVVIIVALSIETLIAVFNYAKEDPSQLPQAAMIGFAAAALLAAWGIFVRLNKSAEELEPEAMAETKKEDKEIIEKER
jgi:glucan phosphoethanolaminetransferase (alkaline phosphatase superfamily)